MKRRPSEENIRSSQPPEVKVTQSAIPISSPIEQSTTVPEDQKSKTIKVPKFIYVHLKQALVVVAGRFDGARITCVPSNATAVNLIPIVKVQLETCRLGTVVMACPSKGGVGVADDLRELTSNSGREYSSLYFSGWFDFQMSAHYHNLRLLTWEPLIETWSAEVQAVVNLSEILHMDPYQVGIAKVNASTDSNAVDFSRLIRFIFARGKELDKTGIVESSAEATAEVNGLDVCYILQCLIAPSCTWLAKYPPDSNEPFSFPSGNESKHLFQHGCPTYSGKEQISAMLYFNGTNEKRSLQGSNTQGALNVNVTGALLDTFVLSELGSKNSLSSVASHTIKNDSGLSIRWTGDLGESGELPTGKEAPLSLKRGFPHRSFISLELSPTPSVAPSLEPSLTNANFAPSESASARENFTFKVVGRIPVDLIGVKKYALRQQDQTSQPLDTTWVIVRVSMRGSAKVVSIESPAFVSNVTSLALTLHMVENGKEAFRATMPMRTPGDSTLADSVPIPPTLLPLLNRASWKLSITSDNTNSSIGNSQDVSFPQPFSRNSTKKGLINTKQVSLRCGEQLFALSACSIRVGDKTQKKVSSLIPEQRMLAFRNAILFRNELPKPILIQVRVVNVRHKISDSTSRLDGWVDAGKIDCGDSVSWPYAQFRDDVECRLKILSYDGENSTAYETEEGSPQGTFPHWSTSLLIPSEDAFEGSESQRRMSLVVIDRNEVALHLSALLEKDPKSQRGQTRNDDIRSYQLRMAQRTVSIYSPFIIVDYTGQNIELKSNNSIVAGQSSHLLESDFNTVAPPLPRKLISSSTAHPSRFGLSNLQKHEWKKSIGGTTELYMLGDEASKLMIRQKRALSMESSRWSETISTTLRRSIDRVVIPRISANSRPLVLCSKTVTAPDRFGGAKTKVISLFNRYSLVNKLDVELEVISTNRRGHGYQQNPLAVGVDRAPIPWHFDDRGFVRLRPKELGWSFSGLINFRKKRRDVSLRVRNKLTGKAIIITIEFNKSGDSPDTLIVMRASRSIQFRVENLTTTPLQFAQQSSFDLFRRQDSEPTILLPYHKAFYSWDFPDNPNRFINLEIADFELKEYQHEDKSIGRFFLDNLAPGTEMEIEDTNFLVSVITDGSTRVLRVMDASVVPLDNMFGDSIAVTRQDSHMKYLLDIQVDVGVSIVDWEPRELVYFRLSQFRLQNLKLSDEDVVKISIGRVSADCQLWLTPFPVLLGIGQSNEGKKALSISWHRDLITRGNKYYRLLRDVDIKIDTVKLKIDGHLASLLAEMGLAAFNSLNRRKKEAYLLKNPSNTLAYDGTTAATASKVLHDSSQDNILIPAYDVPVSIQSSSFDREDQSGAATKPKQKYYIEKIKISSIKAEISWCGSLPLAFLLPRWLSPALMFEALPIMFPPYSNSHVYGSAEEHIESIKSHYNIWRFLFGLSFKPTFILKSCIFTSMQSIASFFNNVSGITTVLLEKTSEHRNAQVLTLTPSEVPIITQDTASSFLLNTTSFILQKILLASKLTSSIFDFTDIYYENTSTRFRAPRLFANQNQHDVLVEYVEGENAGKALLSRVRSGRHLYEGYIGHGILESIEREPLVSPSSQLFFILTFERLLVVTSGRNVNICNVAWEVCLDDITMVELSESVHPDNGSAVELWYLHQSTPYKSAQSTALEQHSGLKGLSSRTLFFKENNLGRQLMRKVAKVSRFCMSVGLDLR